METLARDGAFPVRMVVASIAVAEGLSHPPGSAMPRPPTGASSASATPMTRFTRKSLKTNFAPVSGVQLRKIAI